jgi:hypothetical protein
MINFSNISKFCIGIVFIVSIQIPLLAQGEINAAGSFEQDAPSYWNKLEPVPSGATLTWATDQFRTLGRSLKQVIKDRKRGNCRSSNVGIG